MQAAPKPHEGAKIMIVDTLLLQHYWHRLRLTAASTLALAAVLISVFGVWTSYQPFEFAVVAPGGPYDKQSLKHDGNIVHVAADGAEVNALTYGTSGNKRGANLEGVEALHPPFGTFMIAGWISPDDLDLIDLGGRARVRLIPDGPLMGPPLEGRIEQISSESSIDEEGSYHQVHIELSLEQLAGLAPGLELRQGMAAVVYVETSRQSLFRYVSAWLLVRHRPR